MTPRVRRAAALAAVLTVIIGPQVACSSEPLHSTPTAMPSESAAATVDALVASASPASASPAGSVPAPLSAASVVALEPLDPDPANVCGTDTYCSLEAPLGPAKMSAAVTPPDGRLPTEITFGRYMNARFAFAVDIPRFMRAGAPPGNGDGLVFHWGRRATITAYGSQESSFDLPPNRALGQTWSVSRDVDRDGMKVAELVVHQDGIVVGLIIEYEPAFSAYLAPIVSQVRGSLRMTGGGDVDRPTPPAVPFGQKPPYAK